MIIMLYGIFLCFYVVVYEVTHTGGDTRYLYKFQFYFYVCIYLYIFLYVVNIL